MTEPAYVSTVEVVRHRGPHRTARLPADTTVEFSVHGDVAAHYGVDAARVPAAATTLDYVVAAAAG